jgi:hypothetical protein
MNSCSIKEVIGRIIRNTRVADTQYIADIPEWIAEAMGMMKTRHRLIPDQRVLNMNFHVHRLPAGAVRVMAVVYKGKRLRLNSSGMLPVPRQSDYMMTTMESHPDAVPEVTNIDDTNPVNVGNTFIPYMSLPFCDDWYFLELDHIHTSFSSGVITIYYKQIPTDNKGYPLIIDDEHYKSALYWYTRAMMGGAGYEDKQFTIAQCEAKFQHHWLKAKPAINYLSQDRKEEMVSNLTRLIIPTSYISDCL